MLKHADFAHLREVPEFPNSLRPLDSEVTTSEESSPLMSGGLALVCEMVRQAGLSTATGNSSRITQRPVKKFLNLVLIRNHCQVKK